MRRRTGDDMQTHYSWNAGLMPTTLRTRTTKTLCGLIAPSGRIDNEDPACPDCIAAREEMKRIPEQLPKILDSVTKGA